MTWQPIDSVQEDEPSLHEQLVLAQQEFEKLPEWMKAMAYIEDYIDPPETQ